MCASMRLPGGGVRRSVRSNTWDTCPPSHGHTASSPGFNSFLCSAHESLPPPENGDGSCFSRLKRLNSNESRPSYRAHTCYTALCCLPQKGDDQSPEAYSEVPAHLSGHSGAAARLDALQLPDLERINHPQQHHKRPATHRESTRNESSNRVPSWEGCTCCCYSCERCLLSAYCCARRRTRALGWERRPHCL